MQSTTQTQKLPISTIIFWLIISNFLFTKSVIAQSIQRNYMMTEYERVGGRTALDIENWRKARLISIRQKIEALSPEIKKTYQEAADKSVGDEWKPLGLSDYIKFKTEGNRVKFETLYLARRTRLNRLLIGELVAPNKKYRDEIANGLWAICEESTWVLPAHLYLQKKDEGLPDPTENVIDLFTGETATLLSWAKFLFEEELNEVSPVVVKRLDAELKKRVVTPYLTRNDFWWQGFADPRRSMNNWNIWINTNVLLTAILAENNEKDRLDVIEKTIHSADQFVNWYPEDGGCDEGPGYWTAAGGRLMEYIDLLSQISNGQLQWRRYGLMQRIGSFIYKVHIGDDWYFDFADAPAKFSPDPARIYIAGKMFNDDDLKGFGGFLYKRSNPGKRINGGDINSFINNLLIREELEDAVAKAPLPQQTWFANLQLLMLRKHAGSTAGLFLGAKGGNNGETHNHNDVGSFIIYSNGLPALIDPGAVTYDKQTFSSRRYESWSYTSQWHNCPSINGFLQSAGVVYATRDVSYEKNATKSTLRMNIAGAYQAKAGVIKWIRSLDFNNKTSDIILNESYELKYNTTPFELNFVTPILPIQQKNGVIELNGNELFGKLKMQFDPDKFAFEVEEKVLDDPKLKVWGEKLYRISLKSKSKALKGNYQIKFYN
jgi:hypothetical protein